MVEAGGVELVGLDFNPDPAAPDALMEVTVGLAERRLTVGPLNPNLCNPEGLLQTTGVSITVHIDPDWRSQSNLTVCVPVFNFSSGRAKAIFRLNAPSLPDGIDQTTHSVGAWIEETASGGEVSNTVTEQFTVTSGSAGEEEPTNGQNGGGFNPIDFAINNPGQAAIAVGAGALIISTVSGTATEQILE